MRESEEIADYLFSVHGNGTWKLSNNDAAARPHLQRAIMNGHRKRRQARQQALLNSKKAATEAATAEAELAKEVERQRIIVRNEEERKSKEEEIARLRVSLRPRVEEDVLKMIVQGHLPSSIKLTGNKVYDDIFSELIQPHVERFEKEKSRKGPDEAYHYIARRQKNGIKHLGQWTGSDLTPTEEEILQRLQVAVQNGKDSRSVQKIFNEYIKTANHSGGKRKTRRNYKYGYRSKRNTRYNK